MTCQHLYALAGLWAAAAALHAVTANDVSFAKCAFPIALYNLADQEPRVATTIARGASCLCDSIPQRGSSYDVSIIPPQGKRGFNVPVHVVPEPVTAPSDRCKPVTCGADDPTRCSDGFLFPADKYKLCAADQSFQVVLCPEDTATISSVASGGGGGVGEVHPGNLRGTGSSGGQSFTNATGAITFAQASTTPSMVPAVPVASAPASVGFDAIAGDGANGVAAAVAAVAPGSGSSGSA
ncbi:Secretory protein opel [Globisporangium polare]